jgi:hypothetical protein
MKAVYRSSPSLTLSAHHCVPKSDPTPGSSYWLPSVDRFRWRAPCYSFGIHHSEKSAIYHPVRRLTLSHFDCNWFSNCFAQFSVLIQCDLFSSRTRNYLQYDGDPCKSTSTILSRVRRNLNYHQNCLTLNATPKWKVAWWAAVHILRDGVIWSYLTWFLFRVFIFDDTYLFTHIYMLRGCPYDSLLSAICLLLLSCSIMFSFILWDSWTFATMFKTRVRKEWIWGEYRLSLFRSRDRNSWGSGEPLTYYIETNITPLF